MSQKNKQRPIYNALVSCICWCRRSNISFCMDARLESGTEASSEAAARRLLLRGAGALAAAVLAPPPQPPPQPQQPPPQPQPHRHCPPLTHTLYDVFTRLAAEFPNQVLFSYVISSKAQGPAAVCAATAKAATALFATHAYALRCV